MKKVMEGHPERKRGIYLMFILIIGLGSSAFGQTYQAWGSPSINHDDEYFAGRSQGQDKSSDGKSVQTAPAAQALDPKEINELRGVLSGVVANFKSSYTSIRGVPITFGEVDAIMRESYRWKTWAIDFYGLEKLKKALEKYDQSFFGKDFLADQASRDILAILKMAIHDLEEVSEAQDRVREAVRSLRAAAIAAGEDPDKAVAALREELRTDLAAREGGSTDTERRAEEARRELDATGRDAAKIDSRRVGLRGIVEKPR